MKPRAWQTEFIDRALERYNNGQKHCLMHATPAAGKTVASSALAKKMIDAGLIDFVFAITPNVSVAQSFRSTLSQVLGVNMDGLLGSGGKVFTFQAMQNLGDNFWTIFRTHRVLVIIDEIHHASGNQPEQANAWGETILLNIQSQARYTLALSGTPWRTDCTPVCLSSYCHRGQIRVDYSYSLPRAIQERVCRLPRFLMVDNGKIQVSSAGKKNTFTSVEHYLAESGCRYEALLRAEPFIAHMLGETRRKLAAVHRSSPGAGGLIVATSVGHAHQIRRILLQHFGDSSVVVTHEDQLAQRKIENFRAGNGRWIISVAMISEGTDIPRLRVCCYLSRIRTELYFRQVLGRVLRVTDRQSPSLEDAFMVLPAEPNLEHYVSRVTETLPSYDIRESKTLPGDLPLLEGQSDKAQDLSGSRVFALDQDHKTVISFPEPRTDTGEDTQDEQPELKFFGIFRQRLINIPALTC